ncbi:MAG: hypothetical protein EOO99_04205 [Pedobacter sp.]|nr:MAG: hypothetical protein EOO99_04205 [Pedobacter sp.]
MKFKLTYIILFLVGLSLLSACSTQQDNGPNRRLHNLSARYNYIYNANLLLFAYENELAQKIDVTTTEILPLYIQPNAPDTNAKSPLGPTLEAIADKAYAVIQEKNFSNYIDEAYMLLGKVHYYAGAYYMAAEYFDYVERAYPDDKKIQLQALTWKARTYMQMGEAKMAENLLAKSIDIMNAWKKGGAAIKAEALATLAQYNIQQKQYSEAFKNLTQAQKLAPHQLSRTRWNFVAAQLQETEKNYKASAQLYQKVIRSNASYELYFNAQLGKLRNQELLDPTQISREKALSRLLKDDKNAEVQDRIYAELAKQAESNRQFEIAQLNYQKGLAVNVDQSTQKGLLYLQLAELNFKHRNQYVEAKLYYDSALLHLPSHFPGYEVLRIKAENLTYLSSRYQKINLYDSLLRYAQLSDSELEAALNRKFTVEYAKLEEAEQQAARQAEKQAALLLSSKTGAGSSTFYFNNVVALQKGKNDFQKKWGKRVLEPNWRQANKPFLFDNLNLQEHSPETSQTLKVQQKETWISEKVELYKKQIPRSEADQQHAHASIQKALLEIARFYQQELQDPKEAILIYESYLKKYPQTEASANVHYSLYVAYSALQTDQPDPKWLDAAEQYKQTVLSVYPESDYAKVIQDPQYFNRQQALEQTLVSTYNSIFTDYQEKKYPEVISQVQDIEKRFPGNTMQIQFDYLKAISVGKTAKLPALLTEFSTIIQKYPQDSLITPLIKSHQNYIQQNFALYNKREVALLEVDSTEVNPLTTPSKVIAQTNQKSQTLTSSLPTASTSPTTAAPTVPTAVPVVIPEPNLPKIKTDGLFTDVADKLYYYVVAVESMQHSLSSSRFGIGQFNRGLYGGENLKHQLFDLEEHQVIFVGDFESLEDVEAYTEVITAQLNKIMKVPSNLYKGFYISKANFDLLKSSQNLNRYIQFYKGNLEK